MPFVSVMSWVSFRKLVTVRFDELMKFAIDRQRRKPYAHMVIGLTLEDSLRKLSTLYILSRVSLDKPSSFRTDWTSSRKVWASSGCAAK
jgi:hypothetical protein